MCRNGKSILGEQRTVFRFRQTGVIKGIAFVVADRFAVFRAAGEKKKRPGRRVLPENREHPALILVCEMKKTVPGDEAVECASE